METEERGDPDAEDACEPCRRRHTRRRHRLEARGGRPGQEERKSLQTSGILCAAAGNFRRGEAVGGAEKASRWRPVLYPWAGARSR